MEVNKGNELNSMKKIEQSDPKMNFFFLFLFSFLTLANFCFYKSIASSRSSSHLNIITSANRRKVF